MRHAAGFLRGLDPHARHRSAALAAALSHLAGCGGGGAGGGDATATLGGRLVLPSTAIARAAAGDPPLHEQDPNDVALRAQALGALRPGPSLTVEGALDPAAGDAREVPRVLLPERVRLTATLTPEARDKDGDLVACDPTTLAAVARAAAAGPARAPPRREGPARPGRPRGGGLALGRDPGRLAARHLRPAGLARPRGARGGDAGAAGRKRTRGRSAALAYGAPHVIRAIAPLCGAPVVRRSAPRRGRGTGPAPAPTPGPGAGRRGAVRPPAGPPAGWRRASSKRGARSACGSGRARRPA